MERRNTNIQSVMNAHWKISLELQKMRILALISASAQKAWSKILLHFLCSGRGYKEVNVKERGIAAVRSFLST